MRLIRTAENINGLPIGFQEVEYLESTGTQYIDTGVYVNNTLKTDIHFEVVDKTQGGHIFGGRTVTSGGRGYGVYLPTSGGIGFDYETRLTSNVSTTNGYKYRVVKDGASNTLYVNGVQSYTGNNTAATFDLNVTMALFYMKDSNTTFNASVKCKVFYFKIWDNGTLVRDFIPCLDSSNIPCMWDKVTKQAFYNQGTGTFTTGRQVIPVDYLESTGTQYINTGHAFTDNFAWEITFDGIQDNTTLFGGRTSSARTALLYQRVEGATYVTTCPIAGLNGAATPFQLSDLRTGRHTVKMAVNANKGSVWVDGVQSYNEQSFTGTYISGTTQALFADNFGSSVSEYTSSKVYALKMWQGSTLVRDFIPCKDENNVGFMFDTLSGTVYLNDGTGAFSVGENKYTSKLRLIKDVKELPTGYKRVEYLTSDGNQYIDTEYTINTATDEVSFNFQMISTTLYQWIMGEHDNGARFGIGVGDGANKRNIAYGSTTYKVNDTEIYNSIHYFVANSNGIYLNGNQVHGFESFSSSSTVYLFKLNLSGSNGAAGKIWRYVQKRNGVLIRDMIPCLDPVGRPCMYDKVSGKPFYNKGTGEFTYGRQIIPVEYLESTGTQYIDTGIKLNNNSSVELDYQLTQAVQNRKGLFGGLGTGGSKRFGALLSPSNNQLESGYGSANEFYQLGLPDTNRHTIKQEKNLLYFDGSLVYTFNTATFTQSFNAPLGNFNYTNYNPASAKYYRSKLWNNNTLVRSFIPVRDENNVGYMFDEVTGQLFGNAGSGSFGIGNDLPIAKVRFIQDVIPSDYIPLNYIQSTGTQYIDTGVYPTQLTEVEYRCAVTGSVSNVDSHLFGSRLSASSEAFDLAYMNTQPNGIEKFRFIHGTTTTQETTTSVTASQLVNPHTYYMSGTSFKVDGSEKMSFTTSSFTGTYSLWLFGVNSAGSLHNQVRAQRVYKCKIWDNNTLIRDLYPVLRKSDNKPGMYDRVTKQFYINQGTGEFSYDYL